ncbi:hypothetical protein PI124_g17256 [Phytophthora idaei]|nr:hypothetical protein PI125_g26006 [Phytophthora idaei]KAG3125467.1 hypothetical protein PI126_g22747 [Phytophthora idaei]KAG3237762.1 hypothetical protein PI124_g17256 [Phytophthora idaei]
MANYHHNYSAGYAGLARPLSELLKMDSDWRWERQHQDAFESIKASLQQAPVLALPDETKSFSVVCDASNYAIGCALLQNDADGHERVISFPSRQLKAAERNYPVHDSELLAMKYVLVKFRVHLLGCDLYSPRVLADGDQLATPIPTDDEVAVLLRGVQLPRRVQDRQA